MAELFDVNVPAVSKHLSNVFQERELDGNSVISILETTASDGKNYKTKFYNLDAIISVGYRINSQRATAFRQWATSILRDYAIHGYTAAELIVSRANAGKEYMGLSSWEKSPDGKIVKTDVSVAKNYLTEAELESLGRIVHAYLDLAENRAKRHIPMTMDDWAKRLDKFLEADERDILQNSGKITAQMAKSFAEGEFEKYRPIQDRQIGRAHV